MAQIVTNAIDAYAAVFRQPALQAVAWALLQSVWQGAAVGAATAAALFALRRSAADIRYVVASISLAVMFTLPVVSGVQRYQTLRRGASVSVSSDSVSSESAPSGIRSQAHRPDSATVVPARARFGAGFDTATWTHGVPLTPALLLGWLAGVSLLTLRLLTGWIWMQRIRTHGVGPVEPAWERVLTRLCRQLHITRRIALFESTGVDVPTVIGWLKPVVLLPVSALSALSPAQLEAILAHELAHIRRHDYLINLLQTLVETLLFYHPAVWWVSRRIRIERENCCDDLAVSLCGDPVGYVKALADLESLRSSIPQPGRLDRTVVAATGGSLLRRVRRLLGAPTAHAGSRPAWLAGSAALLVAAVITVSAGDVRAVYPEAPVPPQNQGSRPAAARSPILRAPMSRKPGQHPRMPASAVAAQIAAAPAGSEPPVAAAMSTAAPEQSISQSSSHSHGSWSLSDNGERLQVDYSGTFDFTDDDTDVQQMSAGGYLKISDGAWLGRHSVEISERAGHIEHRYFVNGVERPFEPEGRAWLQQNMPRFVRNTGIAAPSRVARFLKSGGVPAVLAEIGRIDGNYARGIYYQELFRQATLTPEQYRQVLTQASSSMQGSNYELARLLITIADRLPDDEASRAAYFAAASKISSAYEAHRVYSAMLSKGPVPPQVLAGILDHARSLHSDYEVAELLQQILERQPLDDRNRAAFFAAAATIHGNYERHRVLSAALRADGATSPAVVEAILGEAATMTGDYERSTLLLQVVNQNSVEGALRTSFVRALDGIHGAYERSRVLDAVVAKPDVSRDTLKLAIQETRDLPSYEASRLLIAIAGRNTITGDLRDAYIEAADRLSSYEQGQVMTALVRSERRSR